MSERTPEKLLSFLELIGEAEGGVENVAESVAPAARAANAARGGLEGLAPGPDPVEATMEAFRRRRGGEEVPRGLGAGLEAIVNLKRPAILIEDGDFTTDNPDWTKLATDAALRGHVEKALPAIGRIELPGVDWTPYGGTGFVVGDGLVMTNRHVAEIFAEGLGERTVAFRPGLGAAIDFKREADGAAGTLFRASRVVMIHPYWDMALIAVEGLPADIKLTLSIDDARELEGEEIFVVGYPAFDGRNPTDVQNGIFASTYGVKRLQPGRLHGSSRAASFGKAVDAATHDCSTLGGNSGSAVIHLASGKVLGLHFGGRYLDRNFAVPSFALANDARVVDAGVNFGDVAAPRGPNDWGDWWARADAGEAERGPEPRPERDRAGPAPASAGGGAAGRGAAVTTHAAGGAVSIEIPLRITVSLGDPAGSRVEAAASTETVADDLVEGLREPIVDRDYSGRKGYDPGFLGGAPVPMPKAKDPAVLARNDSGGEELRYQNFSVLTHAQRRLALVTAANVSREEKHRKPEPGRDYTRKALGGFGKNDQEKWVVDPRLDASRQLPDVFFTKDDGMFDKGHLVRRDDVAWGETYAALRRANGDTYHVTNCSPQVGEFNRSALGELNWGDLENHVFKEAVRERLIIFCGPVLDPADDTFLGRLDGGVRLRVKIPSRYWKVIVAPVDDGVAAFGFVLTQDLAHMPTVSDEEFVVAPEFLPSMEKIAAIGEMAGVVFDPVVVAADQFGTARGADVTTRARLRPRRKPAA